MIYCLQLQENMRDVFRSEHPDFYCCWMSIVTVTAGIYSQEDEEEYGKSPQVWATIAEKGQGYADDGYQSHDHAYVDCEVEKQDAYDAVAIDTSHGEPLSLCNMDKPQYQE